MCNDGIHEKLRDSALGTQKRGPSCLESGSGSFLGQGEMMAELVFFYLFLSPLFLN